MILNQSSRFHDGRGIAQDPATLFGHLLLCLADGEGGRDWRAGGRAFVVLSMVVLFAGIWAVFLNTVTQVSGQPQQSSVMFFPLPAFLLLTLYWVRWWAVEPPKVWFDQLKI